MPAPHVLVAIDSLDPAGAEMYAVQVVNALVARGIVATLAAGEHNGNGLDPLVQPGVRRLELPWRWAPNKPSQLSGVWNSARMLERYARASGVTTVQTLLPATMIAAWVAAKRSGTPVVHTPMHVSDTTSLLERVVSRYMLPRMDLVVALGTYLRDDTMRAFGTGAEQTVVCRLGVDVDHYTPAGRAAARARLGLPDGLPTVGICTGLRPIKDPMLALRAFAALRRRRPAAFVIVGDGEMRREMEAYAAAEDIAGDVHFTGHCTDVRTAVPAFDVYLETCKGPNLGLAPLETLAMGVPLLVATRNADEQAMAADTLIDGSAGLTAPADPAALAAALDAFFARPPASRAALAAAARKTAVTYYGWEDHISGLATYYHRLAR